MTQFGSLDLSNDHLVRKWKTEILSVIEAMKICWGNLLPNLRDKEILAFRDTEREVVAREKADVQKGDIDHQSLVGRRRSA